MLSSTRIDNSSPGSRVALSVGVNGVYGCIRLPHATWWIEPAVISEQGRLHVVYAQKCDSTILCGVSNGDDAKRALERGRGSVDCEGYCVAQLACDTDYEYALAHGGMEPGGPDVQTVIEHVDGVVNAMNLPYEQELDLTHLISTIIVRIVPAPYDSCSIMPPAMPTHEEMLACTVSEWQVNQASVNRDLVILLSGKGPLIGLAMQGMGICSPSHYCVAMGLQSATECEEVTLVAHELGHLWGASSSHPAGTIMGASCSSTFGPQTAAEISGHLATIDCLAGPKEIARTCLPFEDTFEDSTTGQLNPALWSGNEGATISNGAIGPPTYAMRLNGSDEVRSAFVDTSGASSVTVAYEYQRAGQGNIPEFGDDLVVEYTDSNGLWVHLVTYPGNSTRDLAFISAVHTLPPIALHQELRLGFRTTSESENLDDWWIDNVEIATDQDAPGPVTLLAPPPYEFDVPGSAMLNWASAPRTCNYRVMVADDPSFAMPLVDAVTADTVFDLATSPLAPNEAYCWKVIAMGEGGNTSSAIHRFGTSGFRCPGDATGDFAVSFDDLNEVLEHWGTDGSEGGDVYPLQSGDGSVDFADLNFVNNHFGESCP